MFLLILLEVSTGAKWLLVWDNFALFTYGIVFSFHLLNMYNIMHDHICKGILSNLTLSWLLRDISSNSLSGSIPPSLEKLNKLSILWVIYLCLTSILLAPYQMKDFADFPAKCFCFGWVKQCIHELSGWKNTFWRRTSQIYWRFVSTVLLSTFYLCVFKW